MNNAKITANLLGLEQNKKAFNRILKSEVDKANKRLKRMNNFQKGIFYDKGIEHISRAGSLEDKLKALTQARLVNNSGISTKTEYNRYANQLSKDLSLSRKEVDYMLNSLNASQRDFITGSKLKYGSNPQIDFLYEDALEVNDRVETAINELQAVNNSVESLINSLGIYTIGK